MCDRDGDGDEVREGVGDGVGHWVAVVVEERDAVCVQLGELEVLGDTEDVADGLDDALHDLDGVEVVVQDEVADGKEVTDGDLDVLLVNDEVNDSDGVWLGDVDAVGVGEGVLLHDGEAVEEHVAEQLRVEDGVLQAALQEEQPAEPMQLPEVH